MRLPASEHLDPASFALVSSLQDGFESLLGHGRLSPQLIAETLSTPPQVELGHRALPCFRFAREAGQTPGQLAQNLQAWLAANPNPWIAKTECQGAFLNVFWSLPTLARQLWAHWQSNTSFSAARLAGELAPKKMMVEFSAPNTHKEFHIGHGRGTCLGDTLVRLLRFCGHQALGVNYYGDEGTHIAKCLWAMERAGQLNTPVEHDNPVAWYSRHYAQAAALLEAASPSERLQAEAEISEILREIEARQGPRYAFFLRSREICIRAFEAIYAWLNARFDHAFCESELSERAQALVEHYLASGHFVTDQGAVGIDLSDAGLGFALVRKSDGSTLYLTKDLALAEKKFAEYDISHSIYVVGNEQKHHFSQVFMILQRLGIAEADRCQHVAVHHVVLPQGKMSSRRGNTVTFLDLVGAVQLKVEAELAPYRDSWGAQEWSEAALRLTRAAIRISMLASDHEVTYDPDEWTSFEGNSGPYLLYAYARAHSLLRRGQQLGQGSGEVSWLEPLDPELEPLLLGLYSFNARVTLAAEQARPSVMVHYLFDLCKMFNRCYARIPILREQDPGLRQQRLALVELFAGYLKQGLELLGITTVERM